MEFSKKLEDAYVQRMSKDLQEKFLSLSTEERTDILKALARFHQIIEEETFQFLSAILDAGSKKE